MNVLFSCRILRHRTGQERAERGESRRRIGSHKSCIHTGEDYVVSALCAATEDRQLLPQGWSDSAQADGTGRSHAHFLHPRQQGLRGVSARGKMMITVGLRRFKGVAARPAATVGRCFSVATKGPDGKSRVQNPTKAPPVPLFGEEPQFSRYLETLRSQHPGLWARIQKNKLEGQTLAFAWVTPKSLARGLEGGILARLLSTPELNLIGTRMFAPSNEFVDEYIKAHTDTHSAEGPFKPFLNFLENDLRPGNKRYPNHILLLLFTGENARQRIVDVIGSQQDKTHMGTSPRTIRGSYGEFRVDPSTGEMIEFQPALVGAHSDEGNYRYLRVFSKFSFSDGGILNIEDDKHEFTNAMVMIKPDSLVHPSARPGHIMDLFSSTGLTLIGSSVFSMSVAQAREFYGHLEGIFQQKFQKDVERVIKARLEGAFDFKIPDEVYTVTTALLMRRHAQQQVAQIIQFMTGIPPPPGGTHTQLPAQDQLRRGPARCLALLYRGKDAITTVRSKLGSTDPNKALPGTVRFDYGEDVMKNGAHASDSPEALEREMKIIRFGQGGKASIKKIIDLWFFEDDLESGKNF